MAAIVIIFNPTFPNCNRHRKPMTSYHDYKVQSPSKRVVCVKIAINLKLVEFLSYTVIAIKCSKFRITSDIRLK